MTDMRRTLLWVVFTMSLVLLWDAWNKHNGEPTLFGAPIAAPVVAASAAGSAPGGVPAAAGIAAAQDVNAAPTAAPVASEKFVVTTDVVKATLDALGGSVTRLELSTFKDAENPDQPVVLFDNRKSVV